LRRRSAVDATPRDMQHAIMESLATRPQHSDYVDSDSERHLQLHLQLRCSCKTPM
jgi:hypothetical protein